MSWGAELWDEWDNIAVHTQKGISFLETYSHFVRDRCQVETEYARNLRRLVKNYLPKKKDEDSQFSYVQAFRASLYETGDLAGQHEVIAESLAASVMQETYNLIKEVKEERKKYLSEGNKLQQQLQQSLQQLEKAKKNYEKTFKEAEKAQENFLKADADLHLSRAEVEKQRMNASIKNHQCDDQKNEYANQLQKTNQLQLAHYSNLMPGIFQSLQDLDEKRILQFRDLLKKGVECERAVFPIIMKCLDGIVKAADSVQEKNDSEIVIEKYKSGFTPPGDVPFDDLSCSKQNGGDSTPVSHPPTRQDTFKGTISASKLRKRVGIFGIFGSNKTNYSFSEKDDFNDLPPNQRKKKIQLKMDEVNSKLHQETSTRDGLLKMKEVYTANPSLGDPSTIVGQLNDSCQTIEKLRAEMERYQAMLDEVDRDPTPPSGGSSASGGPNTPTSSALGRHTTNGGGGGTGGASPRSSVASHRTSISDESLSRSASDTSLCTTNIPTPPVPPPPPSSSTPLIPSSSPSTTLVSTTTTSHSDAFNHTTVTPNHSSLHSRTSFSNTAPPVVTPIPPTFNHLHNKASGASSTSPTPPANTRIKHNHKLFPKIPKMGSSHSPESGIGLSRNSLHGSDTYDQPDANDEYDEFYDPEPLPVIGTCTALYQFDATSEGSMRMAEGEKLHLVELDQGDGWTRVRRMDVFEEGFVPTTYIQISLDNNC